MYKACTISTRTLILRKWKIVFLSLYFNLPCIYFDAWKIKVKDPFNNMQLLHVSMLHHVIIHKSSKKRRNKNLHVYLIRRALNIPGQLFIVATPHRNICSLSLSLPLLPFSDKSIRAPTRFYPISFSDVTWRNALCPIIHGLL